jgi:single-stranded DNA-binding protein
LKNSFTLIGRVGSDPELSTGEKEFTRFSVATDASYKKDGEKVERTD